MQNQVLHMIVPNEIFGIKIAELSNWNGKVFIIPRTNLKAMKDRDEANDPALYFLFGDSDESTNQKLYIGESENFFDRLTRHNADKDFWNLAVVFTGGLDKAKVRYLEWLASTEALRVNRYSITNSSNRKENTLKEYDEITTKDYFEKVRFVLSVLGYPVFENIDESVTNKTIYTLKGENFDAKAQLVGGGSLIVLKDSIVRIKESESFSGWALSARKDFLSQGILKQKDDDSYIFVQDTLFKSPSAAAATISGRSINGWTAWKDKKGATLDENLRK